MRHLTRGSATPPGHTDELFDLSCDDENLHTADIRGLLALPIWRAIRAAGPPTLLAPNNLALVYPAPQPSAALAQRTQRPPARNIDAVAGSRSAGRRRGGRCTQQAPVQLAFGYPAAQQDSAFPQYPVVGIGKTRTWSLSLTPRAATTTASTPSRQQQGLHCRLRCRACPCLCTAHRAILAAARERRCPFLFRCPR